MSIINPFLLESGDPCIKPMGMREFCSQQVNTPLISGVFLASLKEAIGMPLIKKPNLDRDILINYRPVSKVLFLSKTAER